LMDAGVGDAAFMDELLCPSSSTPADPTC
jgi:hypothetical protein